MANFKIMRNGLNTEIVGDPHIGQSSEDVTVEVTDDGTYQEYDKKLYYSYGYRNQIYRAIADKNPSGEFIIPMAAFLEPGIVKLSLELSNGTNKPTCNACFLIATDGAKSVAASDILPDEETWQSYIQSYIKSNAEEFKGDTGPQGPKGEKGDAGSVENLEIGGINILLNSNFDGTSNPRENWNGWGGDIAFASNNGINYLHVVTDGSYQGCQQVLDNSTIKNINLANQQFTYSFIGYSPNEGENCQVGIHFLAENGDILAQVWNEFNLKTYPSKYHFTFKAPNNVDIKNINIMIGIGLNSIARNVYIGKPKLEFGEVATDWTPSLEDYENKFNNIIARLEALESK